MKFHKKIRLPFEAYCETSLPCGITICANNRRNLFKNKDFTDYCIDLLKEICREKEFRLFAYCFMPDHIHILIQGLGKQSIIDLVREFKSRSTIGSRKYGFEGKIYQTSFYDHFLQKDDDIEKQAHYILENPVRKGLVDSMIKYTFLGSEVFTIE